MALLWAFLLMGFFDKFGGALISAGASMFGSGIGAASQPKVSYTNLDLDNINRNKIPVPKDQLGNLILQYLTNQDSQRNFYDNLNWLQQQFYKTLDYNSTDSQASRIREAGLNPAMLLGGNAGGSASSAGGAALPNLQAPQYNPMSSSINALNRSQSIQAMSKTLTDLMQSISGVLKDSRELGVLDAQKNKLKADTALSFNSALREYNAINLDTSKTIGQNISNTINSASQAAQIAAYSINNDVQRSLYHKNVTEKMLQDVHLQNLPRMYVAQLANYEAQINQASKYMQLMDAQIIHFDYKNQNILYSNAALRAQAIRDVNQASKYLAETEGIKIDNNQKRYLFQWKVNELQSQIANIDADTELKGAMRELNKAKTFNEEHPENVAQYLQNEIKRCAPGTKDYNAIRYKSLSAALSLYQGARATDQIINPWIKTQDTMRKNLKTGASVIIPWIK